MSYYTVNGQDNFSPPGTILAYIGSTTVDPSGWIIANGTQRTNGSDGRYNQLIALTIGSGVANGANYTPPNLQAMFLRGIGSQIYGSITYSGASYKNKIEHNIAQHSHSASVTSHNHTTTPATSSTGTGSSASPSYGFGKITQSGAGNVTSNTTTNTDNYYPNLNYVWGLTVDNASPTVTVDNNTGNNVGTETRPFNYGVVWIIKL